ncbi:MAG: hypothetical protein ABIM42_07090 [candidate division WOR-3 bacterium]
MIHLSFLILLLISEKPAIRYDQTKGPLDRASNVHKEGRLWMYFNNYGKLYPPNFNMHSGEWPAGSNHEYIYRMAPVIGVPYNVVHSLTRTSEEFEAVGGLNSGQGLIAMSNDTTTWPAYGWPRRDENGNPVIKTPEDSYCAFSDSANLISPLGLLIYQTGHAMGYSFAQDIVFFEWEIVNTGNDTLRDVYFTLYCDIDVGNTPGGAPEYGDDKIVFNLEGQYMYFYDANGFSQDWNSPTGYFGVKFLKTPVVNGNEIGISGFHYFLYDDDPFLQVGKDTIQYKIMSSDSTLKNDPFWGRRLFHGPNINYDDHTLIRPQGDDLVAILSTGPFTLAPSERQTIAIAIAAGDNETAIINNFKMAERIWKNDFLTAVPPPRPILKAIAANRRVFLCWEDNAERFVDPTSGKLDFEGYRVWKSKDKGLTWNLLAEYDVLSSFESQLAVLTRHVTPELAGTIIEYVGLLPGFKDYVKSTNYSIIFLDNRNFRVIDQSTGEPLPYNSQLGHGYSIVDPQGNVIDSLYRVDGLIYISGLLIKITPVSSGPVGGDIYEVRSFILPTGENKGLRRYFIDTLVTNGFEYWYAVTAYDRGDPEIPIDPLESPKTGGTASPNVVSVTPGQFPLGFKSATAKVTHLSGTSQVLAEVTTLNPYFSDADTFVLSFEPMIYSEMGIDSGMVMLHIENPDSVKSYIYRVVVDGLGYADVYVGMGDSLIVRRQNLVTNRVINFGGYALEVLNVNALKGKFLRIMFAAKVHGKDTTIIYPFFMDEWGPVVKMFTIRFTGQTKEEPYLSISDTFMVFVEPYTVTVDSKMLENIRVVPNPFIVKADWDVATPQGLVKHKVQFVNLPPECEIRIFTIDGDLVRTIKHSSGAGYADWDLTNEYGAFVAPGIYIYYVKSPWGEKTGRLGVIR